MAMKVPTFKSQTQPGDEPANIMLGIQANPSAMSQGAVAKANFGNQVTRTGSAVFDLGVQIQELKNTTEATRIQTEYKKGSSLILERSKLFEVKDQEEFVRTERNKLRTSLLNGITYTLKGQDGSEDYVFNVSPDTGSANAIVKNNAVKRTVNSYISQQDALDDVDLHKIQITALTNNLIHDFDQRQKALVNTVIQNFDTASGQVARNELYGTPATQAVVDGQGNTIVNAQPAVLGIIGEMERAGLFTSEADKFKKLQEIDTQVSHGMALNLERRIREAESPKLKNEILGQLDDFQKFLSQEDPVNEGQYLNFPHLNTDTRLKLINQLDDTHYSEVNKINLAVKQEIDGIENNKKLSQLRKEEEILKYIRMGKDVPKDKIVSAGLLEELRNKDEISKAFAESQIAFLAEKAEGKNIIVSSKNTSKFMVDFSNIENMNDVKALIDQTLADRINNTIDQETADKRLAKLYAIKEPNTKYGIAIKENMARLNNAMESLGGTSIADLSSAMGVKGPKTNIESRYENLFYDATEEVDGKFPTPKEIENITDQLIAQYRRQKSSNTVDYVELMTGKDAVLTQHFNSAVFDAYNNMGIVNGQMDPNFPVINNVKDYIVAYQNSPVDSSGNKVIETQVRQAYLSLNDRQQISPRVFNAKLRELALFSLSYDPEQSGTSGTSAINIDLSGKKN